jgi:hypothetical protein
MRILKGAAALALGLALVGHAQAAGKPRPTTKAPTVFDFSLAKLFGPLGGTTTTSKPSGPPPIAQPVPVQPHNTSLTSFLPRITSMSAKPVIGLSTYPTEDQLPGADYLKGFGLKVAPRVKID